MNVIGRNDYGFEIGIKLAINKISIKIRLVHSILLYVDLDSNKKPLAMPGCKIHALRTRICSAEGDLIRKIHILFCIASIMSSTNANVAGEGSRGSGLPVLAAAANTRHVDRIADLEGDDLADDQQERELSKDEITMLHQAMMTRDKPRMNLREYHDPKACKVVGKIVAQQVYPFTKFMNEETIESSGVLCLVFEGLNWVNYNDTKWKSVRRRMQWYYAVLNEIQAKLSMNRANSLSRIKVMCVGKYRDRIVIVLYFVSYTRTFALCPQNIASCRRSNLLLRPLTTMRTRTVHLELRRIRLELRRIRLRRTIQPQGVRGQIRSIL